MSCIFSSKQNYGRLVCTDSSFNKINYNCELLQKESKTKFEQDNFEIQTCEYFDRYESAGDSAAVCSRVSR